MIYDLEHEDFKNWYLSHYNLTLTMEEKKELFRIDTDLENYYNFCIRTSWAAWVARANLAAPITINKDIEYQNCVDFILKETEGHLCREKLKVDIWVGWKARAEKESEAINKLLDDNRKIRSLNDKLEEKIKNLEKTFDDSIRKTLKMFHTVDMTIEDIKNLALEKGFKLKQQSDDTLDLNPYVYDFAIHLLNVGSNLNDKLTKENYTYKHELENYVQVSNVLNEIKEILKFEFKGENNFNDVAAKILIISVEEIELLRKQLASALTSYAEWQDLAKKYNKESYLSREALVSFRSKGITQETAQDAISAMFTELVEVLMVFPDIVLHKGTWENLLTYCPDRIKNERFQ